LSCGGDSIVNQLQQLVAGAAQLGAHGAAQGAAQLGAQLEVPQSEPQRGLQQRILGMQSFGKRMRWQRGRHPLLQLLQLLATGAQHETAAGAAQAGAQVVAGAAHEGAQAAGAAQAGAQAGAAHEGAQAGAAQLGAAEQQLL